MSLGWIVRLVFVAILPGWTVMVFKRLVGLRNNIGRLGSVNPAVGSGLGSQVNSFYSVIGSALRGARAGSGR